MTKYISTRDVNAETKSFENVLLAGLAPDGGLYVPQYWPQFSSADFKALSGKSYPEIALAVIKPFVGDCIDDSVLKEMLEKTYSSDVFAHQNVTPLVQVSSNIWLMEHFHGPTLAFKDVALQLLGRLFDHILEQKKQRVTIVGATSGDTGSAAIEACKNCENVDIFILHPKGRVSEVQRRQMTTINSANVYNLAVEGTFDDCQNMVKAMFNDEIFRNSVKLSAINSINWARIMAQIVYYVTTSIALGAPDRKVSYSVPTGNFGNIFAAYVAQKMGLPIDKLVISTNKNDILTRFFETGEMRLDGVNATLSPSMDIQISSNFERFLFDLHGRDAQALKSLMDNFKDTGTFSISPELLDQARQQFSAHRCDDEQTLEIIRDCYRDTAMVIDPHTAVGLSAAIAENENSSSPIVNLACAHPSKFPDAVEKAIGLRPALPERLKDLYEREEKLHPIANDLQQVQEFVRAKTRAV